MGSQIKEQVRADPVFTGPLPELRSLHATLLFHLNLSYSSIEIDERPHVIGRCYRPLLNLCEELSWLSIAVEASASTLESIASTDPEWIERLRSLAAQGRVEFVGSGDTQLIAPLVPASVNRWNQRLGVEGYRELLGLAPRTALVGEMAFSQGVVDAYLDAGYETLVMEWNNARRANPAWDDDWRFETAWTYAPSGRRIRVLWVDSVLFQKFQRRVMGELSLTDYCDWIACQRGPTPRHAFLYAGDAESFGYRPGRYAAEPPIHGDEWAQMAETLHRLRESGVAFTTPSEVACLPHFEAKRELTLCTASDPIPVKKQPKYNVTRWALTGRDDVGLNADCHVRARALELTGGGAEAWRDLCRAWSSDLRTHITQRRWNDANDASKPQATDPGAESGEKTGPDFSGRVGREGDSILVQTAGVTLQLSARRGLAVESLAFTNVQAAPVVGTIPHGAFGDIDWAADFYSGHTVLEVPAQRRITDLERVEIDIETHPDHLAVRALVPTPLGFLPKTVRVFSDAVEWDIALSSWGPRPLGILRTACVTLLPEAWGEELRVTVANGGLPERMLVEGDFDQGAAVSSLVSARAGFGATDGRFAIDDGSKELLLQWDPGRCAAVPLLTHRMIGGKRFCRLHLSVGEIDETLVPGAPLRDLCVRLSARSFEGERR